MTGFYNNEGSNKLTSAAAYQGENQDLKFCLTPFVNAGVITSSTVIVQAHPAGPQNYTWCKYCCSSEKSSVIRFQLFEAFRIAHINSILGWRKETTKTKWVAFDEDSWIRHKHDVTGPLPLSLLLGQQRSRFSENNMEESTKTKTSSRLLCSCSNSEPGKINIDPSFHLPGCWIRKKILTGRFTVNTSVTPNDFKDGYGLGVALSN